MHDKSTGQRSGNRPGLDRHLDVYTDRWIDDGRFCDGRPRLPILEAVAVYSLDAV